MIKGKIKIGKDLLNAVTSVKTQVAKSIATKIKAEFNTLLMESPQYSGNYVANMRLDVGDRRLTSESIRPYVKYPKNPKSHGLMGPINIARNNSKLDTFEERFVAHVLGLPVWGPSMLMYNNLRESEYIEGMPKDRMREANLPEGYRAVANFKRRVEDIDVKITVSVT